MIIVQVNDTREPSRRMVKTLAYWKNNQLVNVPVTKESVEAFLSAYNGKNYNFIVTSKLHLYATPDSPGYCDGEKTTTVNSIIDGIVNVREIEQVQLTTMAGMIKTNDIRFFTDPGHGWLRVDLSLVKYLGINPLITGYSYEDGKYAYLEEDCDLTTFFQAIGMLGTEEDKPLFNQFWGLCPSSYSENTPIRRMRHYDNVILGKRFNQATLGNIDKIAYKLAKG